MQKLLELELWIAGNFDSQEDAAKAIGTTQTTISKWIGGRNGISKPFQKKLKKLRYNGPFEIKEENDPVSRQEFSAVVADLEDACEVIRFLLSLVPEGSRPGVLPKRFR